MTTITELNNKELIVLILDLLYKADYGTPSKENPNAGYFAEYLTKALINIDAMPEDQFGDTQTLIELKTILDGMRKYQKEVVNG